MLRWANRRLRVLKQLIQVYVLLGVVAWPLVLTLSILMPAKGSTHILQHVHLTGGSQKAAREGTHLQLRHRSLSTRGKLPTQCETSTGNWRPP